MCVRERETDRQTDRECVCVCAREREKHSGSDVCARARRHHSRGKNCVYTESTLAELAVNKHLLGFFPFSFFLLVYRCARLHMSQKDKSASMRCRA